MKKIIILLCLCMTVSNYARESEEIEEEIEQIKIGNFAVRGPQQPGVLFSFGHTIVGKGILQAFTLTNILRGDCLRSNEFIPGIIYGITDQLAVLVGLPFLTNYQIDKNRSSGLEDGIVQFEYAFYNKPARTYFDWATIVVAMTAPTGSTTVNPSPGFGSPNFLIGTVYNHLATDWWYYVSPAVFLTTVNRNNLKYGNRILYQGGFGRNIAWGKDWICTAVLEFDGLYVQPTRNNNLCEPNTGGNIIWLGPDLWIATDHAIIQLGISMPIAQHLFGKQNEFDYQFSAGFTWTF